MTELMYTPLESVFDATMEREGRTVKVYASGSEFRAFMRRNDAGNSVEDRITLFYAVAAPVVQGSIVSYGNKMYILVNRETEENHYYYKSSGLACNGIISLNDGTLAGIPCYAYNLSNGSGNNGKTLSVIGGIMEFITESNSLSRSLAINNTFNEFGRTWKVSNIYYKDGILHIVAEVNADQTPKENLELIIEGELNMHKVGDTIKLIATPYQNTHITMGTIVWSSSDRSIATIDGEGNVTFIKEGVVGFTAYWVEKDYSKNTDLMIVKNEIPINYGYTVKISGREDIHIGYSRIYAAHVYDIDGIEVDGVWEFDIDFGRLELITSNQNGNKLTINIEDEEGIVEEELIITATDTGHNVSSAMVITIHSIF